MLPDITKWVKRTHRFSLDSPQHTLSECMKWIRERRRAEEDTQEVIDTENVINIILENKQKWDCIERMVTNIIGAKDSREREIQRDHRR